MEASSVISFLLLNRTHIIRLLSREENPTPGKAKLGPIYNAYIGIVVAYFFFPLPLPSEDQIKEGLKIN